MGSHPWPTPSGRPEPQNDAPSRGLKTVCLSLDASRVSEPNPPTLPPAPLWDISRPGALILRFGPAVLVAALAVAAYSSGLVDQVNFDEISGRRVSLEEFVAVHPHYSALIYLAAFIGAVSLSLPLALILCLLGGFLMGALQAGLLASIASTLGGLVMYGVARTAVGDLLGRLAGPRIARMREEAQRDAFVLVLTLRLIPMMPFWLINVGAALLGTPPRTFAVATALGVAPSCFIYASLGSGLGSLFDQGAAPSAAMLFEPEVLVPLLSLAALGLLPLTYRLVRNRRRAR